MNEFAKRLKEIRIDRGLTQAQLAKRLGISVSTISMYEAGNREPSLDMLLSLSEVLRTTPGYLINYTVNVDPSNGFVSAWTDIDDKAIGELFSRYSTAVPGEKDEISKLIDISLGLDDDKIQQLINYAKFLGQEEK